MSRTTAWMQEVESRRERRPRHNAGIDLSPIVLMRYKRMCGIGTSDRAKKIISEINGFLCKYKVAV